MNAYGNLMSSLLPKASRESAEIESDSDENIGLDTGPLDSNPNYKSQGTVMIEIPQGLRDSEEMKELRTSLESKGWHVIERESVYSTEDISEGDVTAPAIHVGSETFNNAIMNGIHSVYSTDELYKVVKLVRPEDLLPGGANDIVYLMNSDGEVLDFLRSEGREVADDPDALHRILVKDIITSV